MHLLLTDYNSIVGDSCLDLIQEVYTVLMKNWLSLLVCFLSAVLN